MSSSISSGQNCTPIERGRGFQAAKFAVIKNRDEQLQWEESEQGLSHTVTHVRETSRQFSLDTEDLSELEGKVWNSFAFTWQIYEQIHP